MEKLPKRLLLFKMNKGMIITLPESDNVTLYLSKFSKEILEEANKQDVKVKSLIEEEASQKEFEKVLTNLDYKFIMFNGHGSSDSIYGHKDEPIIISGENEHLLKNRIVYARACEAGKKLGRDVVNESEGCFIGYSNKFIFWADKAWDSVPLKDETAKIFLEPSNMVPISILKGHSTGEADKTARDYMKKNIRKVLRVNSDESFWLASALWTNLNGQVLLGNSEARI